MVISLPSNDVVASFFKDQLMTNNLVIFLPPHHVLATTVSLFLGRSCAGKSFSEEPLCISAVCRTRLWSSTVKGVLLLRLNVGPIRNYWRCIVTGQCSTRQPEHDQP
ncbi:hypothetical protein UPYG_G00258080 [Umbra pygmaea]|uniref:Uncharacterized protein n=1 Tax=Umbra pygmaea TaxID=75934 RepID=A0ABD0W920_UMBPY